MNNPIVDFFHIGGGSKTAKFDTIGRTHSGKIVSISEPEPQTDFDTKMPIPGKFQVRVTLATDERDKDDQDDDGQRTIYVASGWMRGAIAEAVRKAGAKAPAVGGILSVTYTGLVPNSRAKNYVAEYSAPAGGADFLATPAAAPAAAAVAPPAGINAEAWAAMPEEARASVLASLTGAGTTAPF